MLHLPLRPGCPVARSSPDAHSWLLEAGTHGCWVAVAWRKQLELERPSLCCHHESQEKPTGTPPGPVAPGFPSTQHWEWGQRRGDIGQNVPATASAPPKGPLGWCHPLGIITMWACHLERHRHPERRHCWMGFISPWDIITLWGRHPVGHCHPKRHHHCMGFIPPWGTVTPRDIVTP